MKTSIPESFKDYCQKESSFTEEISFDINAELLVFLQEDAKRNRVSFDCYINYMLSSKVAQLKAEQEGFSLGILYCDVELYEEDEFIELIEQHKRILIFDEHLEKKGVILSIEEYNQFKCFE